jgi:hypothetical protein
MSDAPDFAPNRRSTVTAQEDKQLSTLNVTNTDTVADGSQEISFVTTSPNTFADLRGVKYRAPSTGGSGVHRFRIITRTALDFPLVEVEADGTDPIRFAFFDVLRPTSPVSVFPQTAAARVRAVQGITFDSDEPIALEYENDSGQDQTQFRDIEVRVVETVVE